MASAYTPGLTVSSDVIVRRIRRLPIKGQVLVQEGESVNPDSVVAQAMLPGVLQTIKLAEKLGVEAKDAPSMFRLKIGDPVEKDEVVAEGKKLFGFFKAPQATSDYKGTIETISEVTGNVLVREPSIPVDIKAYIQGKIAQVLPEEGAIVETRCAMVQGIFGVGGERSGIIRVAVNSPTEVLEASLISPADKGKILVGGSGITFDAITKAAECGVIALMAGGIKDSDLTRYLGYDIGVAITGTESIPLSILVTEGFGYLAMAHRTFDLLKTLDGKFASVNGATQIRAGVIRPEIISPIDATSANTHVAATGGALDIGSAIRVIREPYFGQLGTVTELPSQLMVVESGTEVRVLRAKLEGGEEVLVPRANVEIIAN